MSEVLEQKAKELRETWEKFEEHMNAEYDDVFARLKINDVTQVRCALPTVRFKEST